MGRIDEGVSTSIGWPAEEDPLTPTENVETYVQSFLYDRRVWLYGRVHQNRARGEGWTMVAERIAYTLRPDELRRDLNLSRERMARLVDVSAKTVERWEHQRSLPARASARIRARFAQIQEVRDLGLCVYTPEGFRQFLRTPLPAFAGRTPLQMIEQGRADDVIAALAADYEGLGS